MFYNLLSNIKKQSSKAVKRTILNWDIKKFKSEFLALVFDVGREPVWVLAKWCWADKPVSFIYILNPALWNNTSQSLPHKYSCKIKPGPSILCFQNLCPEDGDQLRTGSSCSLRPKWGGQVYSALQNVGKIQKPIWLQRLSYDKVTVLVD